MDKKTVDTYCISYNNLWKTLIDNGLKKKDLMSLADVSSATMAKMSKGEIVSLDVICRICAALKCDIGSVLEILYDGAAK